MSPRRIDSRKEQRLLRIIRRDQRGSTAEITNSYNSVDPNSVSLHTVSCGLLGMGLRNRQPKHVPASIARYLQQRLRWAHEHWNGTIKERKKYSWSNESRFLVNHMNLHVRIRGFLSETLDPGCTFGRRHACGGYITVWAMFLWSTLDSIILIK